MALNAVIMAGGEGTRLRPLTCDTPKPMVPVLGKPVLSYSLQLLRRHALTQVGVSLLYLPERITRAFGSGEAEGVRLHYAREREPVGTAGSVRLTASGKLTPTEPFVVLSGDGLTACDLTEALRFHREKKALATMVLARVRDPLAYGVVMADGDGRVRRFVEKPGWGEVYSDTVNTGIYVLSPEVLGLIPERGACDFGQDLFPALVRQGLPVYALVTDAYWCDIGDESAYVRAQADFLSGKVGLDAGELIAPSAQIDKTARLEGPAYIGANAVIGPYAVVSDGAVIGPGAHVGAHARISRSVLWQDACAGEWARLEGAVMGRAAQAGAGAQLCEDSALGDGAALGARAVLEKGAKVWPGKRVDACMRVQGCLVWGGATRPEIRNGHTRCLRPEDACVLAAAWQAALDADTIALCHDGSAQGAALCQAAAASLSAQGCKTLLLACAVPPVLRAVQAFDRCQGGMRFCQGGSVQLMAEQGALPARSLERKAEALAARQDYPAPFRRGAAEIVPFAQAEALYAGSLLASVPRQSNGAPPRVCVFAATQEEAALALRALHSAGIACRAQQAPEGALPAALAPWETGFWLPEGLQSALIFDCHGVPDEARQELLAYAALPNEEKNWLCRLNAPAALDELASASGATLTRIGGDAAQWEAALATAGSAQQRLHKDGPYRMLLLCSLLARRRTTLRGLLEKLPTLNQRTACLDVPLQQRGKLLRALAETAPEATLDGSLRLPLQSGWATVSTGAQEAELVVCGEAADSETAEEICGEILRRLKSTLASPDFA